jgi:predicted secreted protein
MRGLAGRKVPSLDETALNELTTEMEKRRLEHNMDLDLADEQIRHKFRVEVVKIAQKELKQKRQRLQVLKTRFQGVVKVRHSRTRSAGQWKLRNPLSSF